MWRRLPAVLSLFVLSPLIAEYLLGSLPVAMIGILPVMALMYGSAAVLIRETVRSRRPRVAFHRLVGLATDSLRRGSSLSRCSIRTI